MNLTYSNSTHCLTMQILQIPTVDRDTEQRKNTHMLIVIYDCDLCRDETNVTEYEDSRRAYCSGMFVQTNHTNSHIVDLRALFTILIKTLNHDYSKTHQTNTLSTYDDTKELSRITRLSHDERINLKCKNSKTLYSVCPRRYVQHFEL